MLVGQKRESECKSDGHNLKLLHFSYSAFTLAETLITLAIIGVVAALTIPVIISAYQKSETVNGVKEVYSILNQTIKNSEVDNGDILIWNFPGNTLLSYNTTFINSYILPYLKISKTCGSSSSQDCWIMPKAPDGNLRLSDLLTYSDYNKYTLANGMSIAFRTEGILYTGGIIGRYVQVIIDINGLKSPNTFGKDAFVFIIVQKSANSCIPGTGNGYACINVDKGGIYADGFGTSSTNTYEYKGCGKDVTYAYAGFQCANLLMINNWEMPTNYPW
ncbi:MAG: type II secretion system protein [Candidatus Gastranaerophilales bacterium]|nr:type II secretion system protein [Candidatus Gastranaerophilales bacterium]